MVTFYDLKAAMPQGKSFDFAQLKDKVVLIVNTASKCGFTPQFEGLEKLHKTYSPRGFTVLGFPCNQFMSQDPGNDESIGSFCLLVRTPYSHKELRRLVPYHGQVGREWRQCERSVQIPKARQARPAGL